MGFLHWRPCTASVLLQVCVAWALVTSIVTGTAASSAANMPKVKANEALGRTESWTQVALPVFANTSQASWQAQYPTRHWWEGFENPQLNEWVQQALANNPSLAAIEARIHEAEGQQLIASARLKPQAQVGASYAWQYYSKSQFPFALNERIFQLFSMPLQASYELDWLGQARNQRDIGTKGVDVSKLQYEQGRNALAAAVVQTTVQWAAIESLMGVHQQYVAGLEILHNHAKALVAAGQQPAMTLCDAEAALAQGQAQLATDKALRADVQHQLAVLLGQSPAQFLETQPVTPVLNDLVVWDAVPTGLPATLIEHRPDVQAAETALEAADIQIKIAKKNFLPRITITGQTGFTSLYAHRWLTLDALSSAITPAITAPLLTGGANKGRLKIAKAQREQALNQYLNAVNTACGEVETALARLQASTHNLGEKTQRQAAIEDKVGRIHARYRAGLDSEPTYWLAALEQVPAQSDVIVERAQVALDTANLMTALGGGALKEP